MTRSHNIRTNFLEMATVCNYPKYCATVAVPQCALLNGGPPVIHTQNYRLITHKKLPVTVLIPPLVSNQESAIVASTPQILSFHGLIFPLLFIHSFLFSSSTSFHNGKAFQSSNCFIYNTVISGIQFHQSDHLPPFLNDQPSPFHPSNSSNLFSINNPLTNF